MSSAIEVDVAKRLGEFDLRAAFRSEGRLTALFGRSGSGKTSLVNVIAGLVRPDAGRVAVGDVALVDVARGVFTPPHKRRVGYVFQDARLFPHLTVRQNLLFGSWFAPKDQRRGADLGSIVAMLDVGPLLSRRPSGLSGGEKQRVAIGRALLSRPRLLLMDEPLASLDEERKAEIMPYIERLRDETDIPIVYVSHAIAEVARLATTVVMLDRGRVVGVGSPAETLSRADARILDDEAGVIIEAVVEAHDAEFGLTRLSARAGAFSVGRLAAAIGARVRVRVLASDVLVSLHPLSDVSALNQFSGVAQAIEGAGEGGSLHLRIDCNGDPIVARLTRKSVAALGLTPGAQVHAIVKSVSVDALAGAPRGPAIG